MEENLAVYETLRAHILQKENQIANETIYMYVTYFALLTVGSIWNSWISLLPFLILIVFQSMVNSDQWAITRASIYIRVFFESKRNDIHWESLHQDSFCIAVFTGATSRTIGWYICKWGAAILSLLSFLAILVPILHGANYQLNEISSYLTAEIVIAFILCMIAIYVNIQYFASRDEQSRNQKLAQAICDFYAKAAKESVSIPDISNSEN